MTSVQFTVGKLDAGMVMRFLEKEETGTYENNNFLLIVGHFAYRRSSSN